VVHRIVQAVAGERLDRERDTFASGAGAGPLNVANLVEALG